MPTNMSHGVQEISSSQHDEKNLRTAHLYAEVERAWGPGKWFPAVYMREHTDSSYTFPNEEDVRNFFTITELALAKGHGLGSLYKKRGALYTAALDGSPSGPIWKSNTSTIALSLFRKQVHGQRGNATPKFTHRDILSSPIKGARSRPSTPRSSPIRRLTAADSFFDYKRSSPSPSSPLSKTRLVKSSCSIGSAMTIKNQLLSTGLPTKAWNQLKGSKNLTDDVMFYLQGQCPKGVPPDAKILDPLFFNSFNPRQPVPFASSGGKANRILAAVHHAQGPDQWTLVRIDRVDEAKSLVIGHYDPAENGTRLGAVQEKLQSWLSSQFEGFKLKWAAIEGPLQKGNTSCGVLVVLGSYRLLWDNEFSMESSVFESPRESLLTMIGKGNLENGVMEGSHSDGSPGRTVSGKTSTIGGGLKRSRGDLDEVSSLNLLMEPRKKARSLLEDGSVLDALEDAMIHLKGLRSKCDPIPENIPVLIASEDQRVQDLKAELSESNQSLKSLGVHLKNMGSAYKRAKSDISVFTRYVEPLKSTPATESQDTPSSLPDSVKQVQESARRQLLMLTRRYEEAEGDWKGAKEQHDDGEAKVEELECALEESTRKIEHLRRLSLASDAWEKFQEAIKIGESAVNSE